LPTGEASAAISPAGVCVNGKIWQSVASIVKDRVGPARQAPGLLIEGRYVQELEQRLAQLERPEQQGEDFDGRSWTWLALLGVALPAALIIVGWVGFD
jgi:hypothetical protein